ncbi:MAG: AbrB/MazE/SpoVT family DNA-binding domain-containing protein [Nitrososphaerales archaeon]
MSEELLGTSKVTRNYQITLPKKVREELKVREGDLLGFIKITRDKEIIIRPAKITYRK